MGQSLSDAHFTVLMEGCRLEIESMESHRAEAAVACLTLLVQKTRAHRVTQLVSGRGFHAVPVLVSLTVRTAAHPTDGSAGSGLARRCTAGALEVLTTLMSRDRSIKFTNRHIMITLHAALAVLQSAVPCPLMGEEEAVSADGTADKATSFGMVSTLLVAIAVHRPRQWKACLPSLTACIQHMLLSIGAHQLPAPSARQLSRLIEAVVAEAKAAFRKHACYFLSDYLTRFQRHVIEKSVSHELLEGLYLMLDLLEDSERQQLHNALDTTGRERLKQLWNDYEKDFKFRGAV